MDTMLNRMHLLGLIVARYKGKMQNAPQGTLLQLLFPKIPQANLTEHARQLCLFESVQVSDYTLRQLLDTVQNLQVQWNKVNVFTCPGVQEAVDALMHRFGVLASSLSSPGLPSSGMEEYDDISSLENEKSVGSSRLRLSKLCIRKLVSTFLIFYRHMHCWQCKQTLMDSDGPWDSGIKHHHILAASDDFNKLSMHWDLMPAARLTYAHDFRGLYNCVSQVIYFHDADYERRPQVCPSKLSFMCLRMHCECCTLRRRRESTWKLCPLDLLTWSQCKFCPASCSSIQT